MPVRADRPEPRWAAGAAGAGDPVPRSLLAAASLLLPADPEVTSEIVTGRDVPSLPDVDTVLWLRAPRAADSHLAAARELLRGEAQLLRLRRLARWKVVEVRRLPPAWLAGPAARALLRRAALCGAVVELTGRRAVAGTPKEGGPGGASGLRHPRDARLGPPRRLDRVAAEAGLLRPGERARSYAVGSGGVVRVTGMTAGTPVVLRLAAPGGDAPLARSAEALSELAATGFPLAPRLVAHRAHRGTPFLLESRMAGRRPSRLTAGLSRQALDACALLPRRGGPPTSFAEDLAVLMRLLPARSGRLEALGDRVGPRLARLPAIARHGDLWAGNLLARGPVLTGIVDWDAWHPAGVPAADLLQLAVTAARHARRRSLGAAFRTRPWHRLDTWLRPYWRALDVDRAVVDLDAVAVAWWAGEVAGTVARQPDRAGDRLWLEDNVDGVLDLALDEARSAVGGRRRLTGGPG